MLGVGQGQRGVAHQAEVARVGVRSDGLRIFGRHVDVAQASAAVAFVQGRLEERPFTCWLPALYTVRVVVNSDTALRRG